MEIMRRGLGFECSPWHLALMERFPHIDLSQLAQLQAVDLESALRELQVIYDEIEVRNEANTKHLDLPCKRGCDACCHESVFLTPLEFYGAWDWVQRHVDNERRLKIIEDGLSLYQSHKELIEALNDPPPAGRNDHWDISKELRFKCPMLSEQGHCQVYPMRELLARIFGCSFNEDGGVYGCELVGAHLGGKMVTLLPAVGTARRLKRLPLTYKRQVYPFYINELYGVT